MYHAASIKQGQLPKLGQLPIKAQSQIVAEKGEPLDLLKTYALLKEATDNFAKQLPVAETLDSQLHQLLTKKGFYKADVEPASAKATPSVSGLDEAKSKKMRMAKAKAAAAAARIRILKIQVG